MKCQLSDSGCICVGETHKENVILYAFVKSGLAGYVYDDQWSKDVCDGARKVRPIKVYGYIVDRNSNISI